MKKKLLGVLFVLGLLLALPSVVSFAETKNGTCGATGNVGSVKWVLDDNGTLTISGSGDMANYNLIMPLAPWYVYRATIKTVVIEKGVTRIGNSAFQNFTKLTSVTIPNSVISIEKYAFLNCTNRTNVYYTGTKTEWGNVNGKDRLNSATLHYHCGATADDNAYWALVGGTLTISGSGDMANYTNADEVQWKDSVADIKNVVIGNGVTNVGAYAFNGCENLTSVVIPTGVTQIGDNAFNDCNKLANVYYTGTKAEWDALTKGSGNDSLTNATLHYHCGAIADDNVYWALVGDTLTISGSGAMADYADASSVPWNNSITAIKTVGIENGVTNVGDYAFSGCENLTSVTIARSVKNIGDNVFNNCEKLVNVYYAGTQEDWNSIAGKESLTSAKISYCICGAKGNEANVKWSLENSTLTISGSGDMKDYATANGVPWNDSIATIQTVMIENGVTHVGNYAFDGCVNLTLIYIPKGCNVGTYAIPGSANQIEYEVEHTTKNKDKNIDDEKIVVIKSVTKSITLNCDSMGNGYYIIKSEAGESVALSTVCTSNKDGTTTHTGYSMRRREEITDKDHVYGYVIDGERRCIDCGDVQTCKKNGDAVTLGGLTYQCYTCGDGIEVVELNLAAA